MSVNRQDDTERIEMAIKGDECSYEYLVRRYHGMAISYAFSILHDFQSAEDAAQEAFILLYRNIHNLKEPKAFVRWLRRLIRSCCGRIMRKQKFELSIDDMEPPADLADEPQQLAEKSEMKRLVYDALSQLWGGQREAFLMHYVFGMSYAEIAVALEITVPAVANRLYLGKKKLKNILVSTMKGYVLTLADKNSFTKKVLENLHNMVTFRQGQNYMFPACMAYLMECLHENEAYDYWFFSDVLGDSFTQLHRADDTKQTYCLSHDTFDAAYAKRAFDACGYDCTYVDRSQLLEDKDKYSLKIKDMINNGLPVISKGCGEKERTFCVICGYDEDKDSLLVLTGDDAVPRECRNLHEFSEGLLFVGNKKQAPPLAEIYRRTIIGIPEYIAMQPRDGLVFGKKAFDDWADSLLRDDLIERVTAGEYENFRWRYHCTYLCIAGTNGCARGCLALAQQLCPDLVIIDRLKPVYERMQLIYEEICRIQSEDGGWGFFISYPRFMNPNIRRQTATEIRKLSACCDEILREFAVQSSCPA